MRIGALVVLASLLGCAGQTATVEPTRVPTREAGPSDEEQPDPADPGDDWTPLRTHDIPAGTTILDTPDFIDDFWVPPSPVPGTPGNVIWASTSQVVFGGRAQRIMYHSNDTRGQSIGVTGWLGLPEQVDIDTPIISWGHGTTGMADDCAPTRTTSAPGLPFFQTLLDNGYIVVATDYAYLGTPGDHPYYDAATMAYSMIDAAIAAKQYAGTEGPVVYAGYSIGGRGAIFAQAMSKTYAPELDVIGTAAFRPGVDGIAEGGTLWRTLRDSPYKGYIVMAFYGVSLAWGNKYYELEDILSPKAIEALPLLDRDCLSVILETFADIPGDDVFEIGLEDPLPTGVPGPADQVTTLPLLVVAGRSDTNAAPAVIDSYVAKTCSKGQPVELHWLNMGHDLSPDLDEPLLLEWLDSLLAGSERTNSCEEGPIRPKLCRDSEKCFRIPTAEFLEGSVENPFGNVPGLEWELLGEWNHGYACPTYGETCRSNRTEGHVSQILKATIPMKFSEIEIWLEETYGQFVDPTWKIRLYDEEPRPGPPCGLYFQFLRFNNWGFSNIVPGEGDSTMFVFVTHQNRTTQPPMQDIAWNQYWSC
jgi:hypothetical protein